MDGRFEIRTLHCLPELKEGGLERGVIEKAIWLQNHGVQASVVSAGGIWLDRLSDANVKHFILPIHRKNPVSILACARELGRIIKSEDIHLVCAHSRAPAWVAHLATRHRYRHQPPLVVEAQGYYEPFWYSRVMCCGEKVIAVSGAIRDHMIGLGAASDRVVVIPRGFAFDHFPSPSHDARERLRSEWGVPIDEPLIVGVGRLTHTKGWDDLIQAAAMMGKLRPWCALVGSADSRRQAYARSLEDLVEMLCLSDHVRFAGHRDDMPDVYAASDCVVAPSRLPEPFGRVILEALVCGRPVVTTKGCGAAEFLGAGFEDFIVPPSDPEALAECLSRVLTDGPRSIEKAEVIAERARKELTVDRQMWATVDVYRECRPDLPWPSP